MLQISQIFFLVYMGCIMYICQKPIEMAKKDRKSKRLEFTHECIKKINIHAAKNETTFKEFVENMAEAFAKRLK